jgi:hypothetical protein
LVGNSLSPYPFFYLESLCRGEILYDPANIGGMMEYITTYQGKNMAVCTREELIQFIQHLQDRHEAVREYTENTIIHDLRVELKIKTELLEMLAKR